jgi:H+/Cl- antiporter ClcA
MKPNLTRVAVHVFVALATLGLWLVWAPSYFLVFFPGTTPGTTLVHFAAAFAATLAVAVLWAWFIRRAMESRMPGPGARSHALVGAAIAFLLFLFLAVRMLWAMYREWSGALR